MYDLAHVQNYPSLSPIYLVPSSSQKIHALISQLESKGRSIDTKALEEAATGIYCPGGFWGSQVASRGSVGWRSVRSTWAYRRRWCRWCVAAGSPHCLMWILFWHQNVFQLWDCCCHHRQGTASLNTKLVLSLTVCCKPGWSLHSHKAHGNSMFLLNETLLPLWFVQKKTPTPTVNWFRVHPSEDILHSHIQSLVLAEEAINLLCLQLLWWR